MIQLFSKLSNKNYLGPTNWPKNSCFVLLSGRYCGFEIPHPATSFSNSLVINFISDSSVSMKGFRAVYSASTSSKVEPLSVQTYTKTISHFANEILGTFFLSPFVLIAQAVAGIWWCRVVHLTALTIQMLIHQTWNVFGHLGAHQGTVYRSHLCEFWNVESPFLS